MNIKPKILNKILSNKIHENIKKVIDAAQVGFILEMYAWFIILKSINILFHISRLKYKMNQKKKNVDTGKASGGFQETEGVFQVYWYWIGMRTDEIRLWVVWWIERV